MLYNIFKNKKIEEKKSINPQIVVDIHEKNSLVIANLTELGAKIQIKSLQVGDYQIGEIIIERKTFSDFVSSMLSKRLIEQLKNMQQYPKKLIILEGKQNNSFLENTKIHPNSIRGMILTTCLEMNTPVIFTENEKETSDYLFLLAKRQLGPTQELSLHGRIPKTKEEQKKYILESFPEIGPKTAEKLLKEFGSIKNIINAPEESLEKIIGTKAAALINLIE